jgi:hypothetical protein
MRKPEMGVRAVRNVATRSAGISGGGIFGPAGIINGHMPLMPVFKVRTGARASRGRGPATGTTELPLAVARTRPGIAAV